MTGASTSVTAEPVALMLRLRGPEGAVVGQTYTVTVDTAEPVPAGTTLAVTVTAERWLRSAGADEDADSRYSQHAGFLHGTGAGGLRDGDGDGAGRDGAPALARWPYRMQRH